MTITTHNKSALNYALNNRYEDPDANTNDSKILFWDQLALIGAIINNAPNGSNILLARLVLLASKGKFIARTKDNHGGEKWREGFLAAAFCHGCRIRLEYTEIEAGSFFTSLSKDLNLPRRSFSSHDLEYKNNQFVETENRWPFGKQQYGMNVGMYGTGSTHPLKGTEVFSEGNNGHLLLLHKAAPPSKKGAILFGIEGSASMRSSVEGDFHGPNAKSAKISVSGVGEKFPKQAQTFIGSELDHKMNSLIITDVNAHHIQDIENLSKKNLKHQAVAAILNRPKLISEEYQAICNEFRNNHLYQPNPAPKSIWQRMGDWFSNNPWKATAYIFGGIVAVGVAVGALILTGGAAAIPLGLLITHFGLPAVAAIVGTGTATGVATAAVVAKIKTTKQLPHAELRHNLNINDQPSQSNHDPVTTQTPKSLFFSSQPDDTITKPAQTLSVSDLNKDNLPQRVFN